MINISPYFIKIPDKYIPNVLIITGLLQLILIPWMEINSYRAISVVTDAAGNTTYLMPILVWLIPLIICSLVEIIYGIKFLRKEKQTGVSDPYHKRIANYLVIINAILIVVILGFVIPAIVTSPINNLANSYN